METSLFVLTVVPNEGRYLVVEERDGTFYLPAGRVEIGENLMEAALRETAEEAGIVVGLRGILGIDHDQSVGAPPRTRLRFVFVGFPAILAPPKQNADRHSRSARWSSKEELRKLPLRHAEVIDWIERYEKAPSLLPCTGYSWTGPAGARPWSVRLG